MEIQIEINVFSSNPVVHTVLACDDISQSFMDAKARLAYPKWVDAGHVRYIKNLKCFENVRSMILQRIPSVEIARQIQMFGEGHNHSLETLRQKLEHYRATIPKAAFLVPSMHQHSPAFKSAIQQLRESVNVVEDMNRLKQMMFERLEIALKREREMGFLLPGIEKQYDVQMRIIKELGNAMRDYTDAVVDDARPPVKTFSLEYAYSDKSLEAIKSPSGQLKVAKFAKTLMDTFSNIDEQKKKELLEKARAKFGGNDG